MPALAREEIGDNERPDLQGHGKLADQKISVSENAPLPHEDSTMACLVQRAQLVV